VNPNQPGWPTEGEPISHGRLARRDVGFLDCCRADIVRLFLGLAIRMMDSQG
jgi:hypothetical protein